MFAQLTSYIALCLQRSSKAFDFSHNDCVELIVCCQWRRMPDCSAGPKEKKNTNMNGRERTIDRRRWSMGESSDEQTWSMHFANSTINTSSSRHLSSIVVLIIIMDESIQYRSKSSASMELNRKDCCMIQSQLTSVEKRNTKRTHFHNVILCACPELYVWHRRNKIHSRTKKKNTNSLAINLYERTQVQTASTADTANVNPNKFPQQIRNDTTIPIHSVWFGWCRPPFSSLSLTHINCMLWPVPLCCCPPLIYNSINIRAHTKIN